MRIKNVTSIMFAPFLIIVATTDISYASRPPIQAIAFQNEGTTDVDIRSGVLSVDGVWSPIDIVPTGTVCGSVCADGINRDFYATGTNEKFFDAISLEFDSTGLDLTALKLRCYLQKGAYGSPLWEHYQILPGTFNTHNEDVGSGDTGNFPPDVTRHSPINVPPDAVVGWVEFPFDATSDPSYILTSGNIGLTLRLWNWRVDAVELVGSYPFSDFSITKAEIGYKSANDNFSFDSEFTLHLGSDGIDPTSEDVVLTLGTFSVTIPSSFVQNGDNYIFEGIVGDANLHVEIKDKGETFDLVVNSNGVDLGGSENPTAVEVLIGNDIGSTNIRLDGKLKFKAGK